jgi:NitT/TauT family transport system ATP-binding protein
VTVLFVSHLIGESVLLADRVVVMTPRPGTVADIVSIDLARPREADTRSSPVFFALVNRIRSALREAASDPAG